ncbi:MAG: alpha/beta hydrolase [Methylococcales bacterium]|nr:alpha/beta hydrolase [Methylococcales bacterium]
MENLHNKLGHIKKHTECIILIHGLARTSYSMNKAAKLLTAYGYDIINLNYPSRKEKISSLVSQYLQPAIKECETKGYKRIHFLTHSMGGILLRYYLSKYNIQNLGKTVMLAPPNQGSEIVDKLGHLYFFSLVNGPAGLQMGTGKNSIPIQLGDLNFETGIIAGYRTINPLLSLLIPRKNDGKVAVERTKISGMKDFLLLPYTHTFIMQRTHVIYQALYFIQTGGFFKA